MKKILATAVALGLVVGVAASASALELKITGRYQVEGYYLNQGNGAAGGGGIIPWNDATYKTITGKTGHAGNDDWYENGFRIKPNLIINDKIQIKSEIRLIDKETVWGHQEDNGDLRTKNGGNMNVKKLWLLYDSPIGRWEIGRQPAGSWGSDFVNSGTAADRIMFRPNLPEHWHGYAFLEKQVENDAYNSNLNDHDNDYYEVSAGYTKNRTNVWLGAGLTRDKDPQDASNQLKGGTYFGGNAYFPGKNDFKRITTYHTMGFLQQGLTDNLTLVGEFDYKWGHKEFTGTSKPDQDISAWAYFAALAGNYGDLSTTLGYAHIDGDSKPNDNTDHAYDVVNGTGTDFQPLYILTGSAANILNGYRGSCLVGTMVREAGVNAFVALADYKTTDKLTLHAGIGTGWAASQPAGWNNAYGWEFDLGAAYKLYNNLTYEVHFGYWAVGDFAKGPSNSGFNTQDVYLVSHSLTMKF